MENMLIKMFLFNTTFNSHVWYYEWEIVEKIVLFILIYSVEYFLVRITDHCTLEISYFKYSN